VFILSRRKATGNGPIGATSPIGWSNGLPCHLLPSSRRLITPRTRRTRCTGLVLGLRLGITNQRFNNASSSISCSSTKKQQLWTINNGRSCNITLPTDVDCCVNGLWTLEVQDRWMFDGWPTKNEGKDHYTFWEKHHDQRWAFAKKSSFVLQYTTFSQSFSHFKISEVVVGCSHSGLMNSEQNETNSTYHHISLSTEKNTAQSKT